MKKKIIFGILFSAILTFNVINVFKTDANDVSLMQLIKRPQAQAENFGSYYPCGNKNVCVFDWYWGQCCSCGYGSICYCYCD